MGNFDQLSQTASETLDSITGVTTAAASTESFKWLVEDDLYITLGYASSAGDEFAVKIQRQFHMIGFGDAVIWSTYDAGAWSKSTENTSPKTWTFSTCEVVATPTLDNDSGSISVEISTTSDGDNGAS